MLTESERNRLDAQVLSLRAKVKTTYGEELVLAHWNHEEVVERIGVYGYDSAVADTLADFAEIAAKGLDADAWRKALSDSRLRWLRREVQLPLQESLGLQGPLPSQAVAGWIGERRPAKETGDRLVLHLPEHAYEPSPTNNPTEADFTDAQHLMRWTKSRSVPSPVSVFAGRYLDDDFADVSWQLYVRPDEVSDLFWLALVCRFVQVQMNCEAADALMFLLADEPIQLTMKRGSFGGYSVRLTIADPRVPASEVSAWYTRIQSLMRSRGLPRRSFGKRRPLGKTAEMMLFVDEYRDHPGPDGSSWKVMYREWSREHPPTVSYGYASARAMASQYSRAVRTQSGARESNRAKGGETE